MRKTVMMMACVALAAPGVAKERTVVQPLPKEFVANVTVIGVDIEYSDATKPAILALDDRARVNRSDKGLPRFDPGPDMSRNDYATIPTTPMLSQMVIDTTRNAKLTGGSDVRLKIAVDTIKFARKSNIAFGKPLDRAFGLFTDTDDYEGDDDEIAGFVDVYTVNNKRVASFYIDVVNSYSGLLAVPIRGRSVREKLAEEFSKEITRCLTTPKCNRYQRKPS
jgi:hypothetical protein